MFHWAVQAFGVETDFVGVFFIVVVVKSCM